MNPNGIEAFLAVIESGSVSAAAKKLYIGQPTVSARIQALESELGVKLLQRGRGQRAAELTAEGRVLENYANRQRVLTEELRSQISLKPEQHLDIAAGHSIMAYIMPDAYLDLPECCRDITMRLWGQNYAESYELTERGAVDAAFVSNLRFSKRLKTFTLFQAEQVAIFGPEAVLRDGMSPGELDVRSQVYIRWDERFRQWQRYWFGSENSSAVQCTDVAFIERFAAAGRRWSIVPIYMARALNERAGVRYCRLSQSPPPMTISLICAGELYAYPSLTGLLDSMKLTAERLGCKWLM